MAPDTLSALRHALARLEQGDGPRRADFFSLGSPALDEALGGGLAFASLHEIYAQHGSMDSAAASGFALGLALRAAGEAPLVWIRQDAIDDEAGRLHAPGLVEFGLHPDRLILIQAPDISGVLRAGAEALRCGALGAVLLEAWGEPRVLDLTATRRLALAAGRTRVTPFLIRIAARPTPSAATTRWSVEAGTSFALEANAPGFPVFKASLLRHRAGLAARTWLVEWDRDRRAFDDAAPLSRRLAALPPGESAPAPSAQQRAGVTGKGERLRRAG
jgi:protein ImuA